MSGPVDLAKLGIRCDLGSQCLYATNPWNIRTREGKHVTVYCCGKRHSICDLDKGRVTAFCCRCQQPILDNSLNPLSQTTADVFPKQSYRSETLFVCKKCPESKSIEFHDDYNADQKRKQDAIAAYSQFWKDFEAKEMLLFQPPSEEVEKEVKRLHSTVWKPFMQKTNVADIPSMIRIAVTKRAEFQSELQQTRVEARYSLWALRWSAIFVDLILDSTKPKK